MALRFVTVILLALQITVAFAAAPFPLATNPRIDPAQFRVTTFASGLPYPTAMQKLSDGSLLVAVNDPTGGRFYASTGKLLRLTDNNNDGVADDAGTYLNTNLPGGIVQMRQAGDLLIVNASAAGSQSISILRKGATTSSPYTTAATINFAFPSTPNHMHDTYALAIRPISANQHDVYFNVGSRNNASNDATAVPISGALTGSLAPESLHRFTLTDNGSSVSLGVPQQLASGIRNGAGIAFHPTTGNMYFQDNGIDGTTGNPDEPVSADELNVIPAGQIGVGPIPNFGFSTDYIQYRTGARIGSGGVQPVIAFQPFSATSEAEGAAEIAFAPSNFPASLNTGLFVTFHGSFSAAGIDNEENPLVYVDLSTNEYFEFIDNDRPNIGHIDNVLATSDSLFLADMSSTGNIFTTVVSGNIYQVQAIPEPALSLIFPLVALGARRRRD